VLMVALVAGLMVSNAFGFDISADQELEGGAILDSSNPPGDDVTPSPSTFGHPTLGGYKYDLTDQDGPGPGTTGVSSPGINLQGNKLWNDNAESFELDLAGGNLTGTGAKAIETIDVGVPGGTHGYHATKTYWLAGDVAVRNVADVSAGGIVTFCELTGSNYGMAGDVVIGEAGDRANSVRVDYIDTHGKGAGARAGNLTIYSNGDVKIEDGAANPGDILAYATSGSRSGTINIQHDGAFKARDVQDYLGGAWTGGEMMGSFTAEGDVVGDGASGSFECRDINQYFTYWSYRGNVGFVDISGYTGVLISGGIDTHSTATGSNTSKYASNVTIEDIEGDIVIVGAIDLQGNTGGTPPDPQYNGVLTLETIASKITLGDEANPGAEILDLDKVKYILFDSETGVSWIWHDIDNWSDGSDTLRVGNPGDVVYYSRGANPDLLTGGPLGDGVYPLTGGGIDGTLEPTPLPVPEPAGLGLLGLALLSLWRSRSAKSTSNGLGLRRRRS